MCLRGVLRWSLLLWLTLWIGQSRGQGIPEDNGVLVLDSISFDAAISQYKFILVEFYAPWCGHCQKLAPEYEKAAQMLKKMGSDIKLAKVDATQETMLAQRYGITGYPMLRFFRHGHEKEYTGPRDARGIVSWVHKKTGPPFIEIRSTDEMTRLTRQSNILVVGFFSNKKTHDAKEYILAADDNKLEHIPFVLTHDSKVFEKYKMKADGIIMLKRYDDRRLDYAGEKWAKDINAWVNLESTPLVSELTKESSNSLMSGDIKTHFLLVLSKDDDQDHKTLIENCKAAARDQRGKISFFYLNTDKDDNKQLLQYFGLDPDEAPLMIIYKREEDERFVEKTREITVNSVKQFIQNYNKGVLKRHLRTEEVPTNWNKGDVKVLVSKNFKEVALDRSKDVFVNFISKTWCNKCENLEPKWKRLAAHYKEREDVVIATMDIVANEIEEVRTEKYPHLVLFKKETNEQVVYIGRRRDADMIKFLDTGEQEDDLFEDEINEDIELPEEDDEDYDDADEDDDDEDHDEL